MNIEVDRFKIKVTPLRIAGAFALLVLAAFLAMMLANKHEIDSLYSEGLRQQQLKNYQLAVDIFKQIGIRYWGVRKAEKALLRAAEIYYYDINNFRLARDILENLIPRSKYPEYLVQEKILLAGIYSDKMNKLEEAFNLLNQAEELDVSETDKLNILLTDAKICQKMESYEKATGYYLSALSLCQEPECIINVRIKLAASYTSFFERTKAEKIFRELLVMPELKDDQRTRIEWQLFQNLDEQDRYEEAMKIINIMLTHDPGNETLLMERKRVKEEIDFFQRATQGIR
jgi:tetratricopeptide (TPR) repeat protein